MVIDPCNKLHIADTPSEIRSLSTEITSRDTGHHSPGELTPVYLPLDKGQMYRYLSDEHLVFY